MLVLKSFCFHSWGSVTHAIWNSDKSTKTSEHKMKFYDARVHFQNFKRRLGTLFLWWYTQTSALDLMVRRISISIVQFLLIRVWGGLCVVQLRAGLRADGSLNPDVKIAFLGTWPTLSPSLWRLDSATNVVQLHNVTCSHVVLLCFRHADVCS
jgi:hypothetical protein